MSTAVPVIAVVSPTYRMAYIHHITTLTAHMYARRRIQFPRMCVLDWLTTRRDRVGSAPPPHPASPSLVLSRHRWTDVMAKKMHLEMERRTTLDTCTLGSRATVPAHQCRQPPWSFPNDADHQAGRPPPPRYMGLIAGHRCLDRRP